MDTVPLNMGTLGLEDGRDAELFIPLLSVGRCRYFRGRPRVWGDGYSGDR